MKKAIIGIVIILILIGGFFFLRPSSTEEESQLVPEPTPTKALAPIGEDIEVDFKPNSSRIKAVLTIGKLNEAGVESLEYEILYETEGLTKGVNSGSTPIEVDSSGIVEREIDFGTCSSGVCRYDKDVGKITLVIRFNTSDGPKIFKKEYL